ncbi:hypothetical protein PV328_010356 [Microctonus aethiopoides]|uniref:Uncharacterized protein n=1 Tax=Microctonus aethiopoides TaxID=144406 RepID=A0AA39FHK1_9HYME|nr:hypothetical protein PV328_010356 [Microctonus aethiopoides]
MVAQPTQHVHTNNNQGHPDLPSRQIYQHPNIDNINSVRDETPLTIMTDSLQQYNNRYLYDQTPSPSIINAHINLDQQTPDNMRAFHNLQTRNSENRAITREEFRKKFQELGYLRETMVKMAETMDSMVFANEIVHKVERWRHPSMAKCTSMQAQRDDGTNFGVIHVILN